VIADVTTTAGDDVARAMLASGHARPYAGGARRHWCAAKADHSAAALARAVE
jgi:endonuclease YncB( thermonuclease family)